MSSDLKQRIGQRVRALRESRGLTQEQLAEAIDRSVQTVSNIERGRRLATLDAIEGMAQSLNVPISDFFDEGRVTSPNRAGVEARIRDVVRDLNDLEAEVALHLVEGLRILHRQRTSKRA
jgi:transcriptional regulator with XRE-family HTH domain